MAKTNVVEPISSYMAPDSDNVIYDSDLTGWIIAKCEKREDARNAQYKDRWH